MSTQGENDLGELVALSDPDRYVATLFAPRERWPALFALYAFDREVARISEAAREPLAGHIRLGWWRDQIEAIYAGGAVDGPVAQSLALAVRTHALPREVFEQYVDARACDLEEVPFLDEGAMERHAIAVSGGIARLAARVLGAEGRADGAARLAGIARAYAGHIGALAVAAQGRRCRVPLQWLEDVGANADDLFAATAMDTAWRAVVDRIGARALEALDELNRSTFSTRATPALAPATLARWVARGFDPFQPRALPAWQRVARIAWCNLTWRF